MKRERSETGGVAGRHVGGGPGPGGRAFARGARGAAGIAGVAGVLASPCSSVWHPGGRFVAGAGVGVVASAIGWGLFADGILRRKKFMRWQAKDGQLTISPAPVPGRLAGVSPGLRF